MTKREKQVHLISMWARRVVGLLLTTVVGVLHIGCGGGANNGIPTPSAISGRVVDGYLVGAQVFWDCNDDFKIDEAGEPWVTSQEGGKYTIEAAPNASCILRSVIPSWATDETTNSPVGREFRMSATADNPKIITPITTLITDAGYTQKSLEDEFGYQGSPGDDYLAQGSSGKNNAAIAGIVGTGLMSANVAMKAGAVEFDVFGLCHLLLNVKKMGTLVAVRI